MKKRYEKEMSAKQIAEMADEDIDYSDIPELGDEFWQRAEIAYPKENKKQLTVRLDTAVVSWFRAQGKGYQTHMNAVLREYVRARKNENA